MKGLIKSGLLVALGWLATTAHGQDIQWRASTPKQQNSTITDSNVRGVSLSVPVTASTQRPVARGQQSDNILVQPLPTVEPGDKNQNPKPLPRDNGFKAPTPKSEPIMPSPIFDALGMTTSDDCCLGGICRPKRWLGHLFGHDHCGIPGCRSFYASAEYLMWWQKDDSTPPLVTSSPAGVPLNQVGIIGLPTTSVLYSGPADYMRSGGRFTFGWWSSHFCNLAFETSFFFLARQSANSVFTSSGDPQLARPFFDSRGFQNAEIFSSTDRTGSTNIGTFSELWGIEFNARRNWWCGCKHRLDVLAGYRYLNLREGLGIEEELTFFLAGAPAVQFIEREAFRTRTQFHGGQVGVDGEWRMHNRWWLGWNAKVAMGCAHHVVTIEGSTTRIITGGPTETQPGALLASPTNIGRYEISRFAVVPEVGVKLGYDLTDNLRVFVGYNFLYLSSAVRPGDQIDVNVNQSFRPFTGAPGTGPRLPAPLVRTTDYWAQGMTFGLLYRY